MTLLTYESTAKIARRWSTLALFGFAAGLLNLLLVVRDLYIISSIDDLEIRGIYAVTLILETIPIVFLGTWAVATVMRSGGRLRGLAPAVLGSLFASSSGLIAVITGGLFALEYFFPNG